MTVSKKKKWLIAVLAALFLLVTYQLALGYFIGGMGFVPYNAQASELDMPKTKILFMRPGDCGFTLESCSKLDIYDVSSDGGGEEFLFSTDSRNWPPYPAFGERTISRGMGWYEDASTIQMGRKRVKVEESPPEAKLTLYDGDKETVLEDKQGLFPRLGIEALTMLQDGRHLLVEDGRQQIGIYDTVTHKYAYLADGRMAFPETATKGIDISSHRN